MNVRTLLLGLAIVLLAANASAQTSTTEQEVIQLSKDKWQWMADKAVDKLEPLFHERSKFVHMSGTWKKAEELDIIKTGSIWYKQTDVHDVTAQIFENTAVVWTRLTLTAVVRGADAKNEFTATEVYQGQGGAWKLLALTFSSVGVHPAPSETVRTSRSTRGADSLASVTRGAPIRSAQGPQESVEVRS